MIKIVQYPSSILTTPCQEADFSEWKPIATAIGDLTAGMNLTRKAVGLSAPQVGHSIRVFILDVVYLNLHGVSKIFINPVVTEKSSLEDIQDEACMSLPPSVLIPVKRPISSLPPPALRFIWGVAQLQTHRIPESDKAIRE